MRKLVVVSFFAIMLSTVLPVLAQQDTPENKPGDWFCPGGRGFGRMAGRNSGMCMNQRRGECCQMGMRAASGEPLNKEQAQKLLQNYVLRTRNPNLKTGELLDKGAVFEATVVTKEGSLVEKIEIDKNTGFFRRSS